MRKQILSFIYQLLLKQAVLFHRLALASCFVVELGTLELTFELDFLAEDGEEVVELLGVVVVGQDLLLGVLVFLDVDDAHL